MVLQVFASNQMSVSSDAAVGANSNSIPVVRARSVRPVPVLRISAAADVDNILTDPVGLESMWLSKNGSYINLSLLLKSGKAEGDTSLHTLGIVSNGTTTDADGHRTLHLTLYHDQGGVPEYYTVQQYVSVDTHSLVGVDAVEIAVNTYSGLKTILLPVN